MIGVAPPSLGSNSPPVPGMGAAPPAQPQMPPAGGGYGAPAPMPPGGTAAMPAAPAAAAPPQPASAAVNPLGGTVVADAGAFGGGGFPPAGGAMPPAAPGGYDIGTPPPGFGAPPPGFAQPPAQPGYGAPPQGMDPGGFGATAQSASPVVAPPAAMAPMDEPLPPIPGTVGGANPIVTVLLIVLTCGIYGIYLLVKGKKAPAE